MEFNVAYGIKTDAQMLDVIDFFNARQGKLRGFRYKNWANYQVLNGNIAIGDGINRRLPMVKTFGVAAAQTYKRMHKIVKGSVTGVTIGGAPLVENKDFAIDYNSGEIVFAVGQMPGERIPVKAQTLEFDEPVRFDIDSLQIVIDGYNNNSLSSLPLIGIRDQFTYGTIPAPDSSEFTQYTASDPYYGSTRLLLKANDVSDPTTTVDESRYTTTTTLFAPAVLTTQDYVQGSGSFVFGDTGRIECEGERFGISNPNTPFDVEMFIKRPAPLSGNARQPIIGKWDEGANNRCWLLRYEPGQDRLRFMLSSDGVEEITIFSHPWTEDEDSAWQHLAITRLSSGMFVMRLEGDVIGTAANFGPVYDAATPLNIGGFPTYTVAQGSYQGGVDSLRITYGRTRYAGVGSIIIPSADYPV